MKSNLHFDNTASPLSPGRFASATKKLAAYSATTIGALCINQACSSDVISYSPSGGPVTINNFDSSGFNVDFNNDATDDFLLIWGIYFGFPSTFIIDGAGSTTSGFGPNNLIDSTQVGDPFLVDLITPGGMVGPAFDDSDVSALFDNFIGTRGFVGVQFEINDGSATNVHFGYLDVEVNSSNTEMTLHGGAYESDPGVKLTTVPEPGSLAFLAIGAAAASTVRRRKEAATSLAG